MGRWQLIIVSVYVHCKSHRKRSDIKMNETLNLHRQRTKWTADIELDNISLKKSSFLSENAPKIHVHFTGRVGYPKKVHVSVFYIR